MVWSSQRMLAMAKLEMIDGKSKELLDGSLAANGAGASRRKIGGAVGIESHVNDGLLEDDFVEGKLGTKKRDDLQASDDAVRRGLEERRRQTRDRES